MSTAVFSPSARCADVFLVSAMLACGTDGVAQEAVQASEGATAEGKNVSGVDRILVDACRADYLSCYGYGRATSLNIDELAERGRMFERNFAQAPNTLLSVPTYIPTEAELEVEREPLESSGYFN